MTLALLVLGSLAPSKRLQHPLKRNRQASAGLSPLGVDRLARSGELLPGDDPVDVVRELRPTRGLGELLKTRQRLLLDPASGFPHIIAPARARWQSR